MDNFPRWTSDPCLQRLQLACHKAMGAGRALTLYGELVAGVGIYAGGLMVTCGGRYRGISKQSPEWRSLEWQINR